VPAAALAVPLAPALVGAPPLLAEAPPVPLDPGTVSPSSLPEQAGKRRRATNTLLNMVGLIGISVFTF
jgi:hypothetical protein